MNNEVASHRSEGDIGIEETLKRLADEDPEIKKALEKIEGVLKDEFKKRPWRYMSFLEIDPEITEALKLEKVPLKALGKWRGFSLYVSAWIGAALWIVADWGLLNWRSWVMVGVTIAAIEIWKHEIEKEIEERGGLKQ